MVVQIADLRGLAFLLTLPSLGAFVPQWPSSQRHWSVTKVTTQLATTKRVGLKASSLDVGITNLSGNSTNLSAVNDDSLPEAMLVLPRHSSEEVNKILKETEHLIRNMHKHSKKIEPRKKKATKVRHEGGAHDAIFANTYVDLGKVDTVGFDYDYTLVTYTDELLELIYDMALKRLVHDRNYPLEMLDAGLAFDPFFSIRGRCAKRTVKAILPVDARGQDLPIISSQALPSTERRVGFVTFHIHTKLPSLGRAGRKYLHHEFTRNIGANEL